MTTIVFGAYLDGPAIDGQEPTAATWTELHFRYPDAAATPRLGQRFEHRGIRFEVLMVEPDITMPMMTRDELDRRIGV